MTYDFLDWNGDFAGALIFGSGIALMNVLVYLAAARFSYVLKAAFVKRVQ